jgi:hypothetical protein
MISSRASTACGFSIFAITGTRRPFLVHDLVDPVDVGGVADEGQGDHVDAGLDGPAQVVLVLLAQCRHVHGDAGKVDALVVGHHAADDDLGDHLDVVNGGGPQRDLAVVDEQQVPTLTSCGKALERGRGDFLRSQDVLGGDGEHIPARERVGPFLEAPEADLGPLKVGEDTHRLAQLR